MKFLLGTFFTNSAGAIAKRVLAALGLGIISYAGVATALATAIGYAQATYTGFGGYIAAFAGLGGIGEALGMIAGAMTFRVTVAYLSKIGVVPK
ncbi:DUF2523 domain-containing protein [Methylobacillus sp. Pita1]|uniref:DUF2523 domain-containing protein n=1 Tax=Methylobacillus sp. Pita1 TaxID=3382642 RepID=UPI0038B5B9B5